MNSISKIFPVLLICWTAGVQAQLRIVDYNTGGGPRDGIDAIFAAIGVEQVNGIAKAPDVIALQEQTSSTTTLAIVDILNALHGAGTYAAATLNGATSGAGRPGLIYNTQTVELLAQAAIGTVSTSGQARQTMRYQLRPVGYDSEANFYVYSSHYKASSGSSNAARRNVEAQTIRANADALGQGAHIIYAGDFNIYSSSEPMWATLTAAGNGQAFDPIDRVGSWSNNSAFRDVHTQSPASFSRYSGQVTGGMDDRFDYQLATAEFLDGEGLSYIAGSYRAFGNTGTHALNGDITGGSAAALAARLPGYSTAQATQVLQAIASASDHLPVVADYQVPARMVVKVLNAPASVIVGADATITFSVANDAPVVAANGADELDYIFSAGGAVAGGGSGTEFALGGADSWQLAMDAGSIGLKSGTLNVTTDSQGAANREYSRTFDFGVLDHASPAFLEDGVLIDSLDFGDLSAGEMRAFSLWNMPGLRAGLDLDEIIATGDAEFFTLDLETFVNLAAGADISLEAAFLGTAPGSYTATFEFRFSDEDLPGSQVLAPRFLTFTAAVVPEPATLALVVIGLGAIMGLRRRG